MLILTRKPNEAIMINDDIKVIFLGTNGRQIRLGFEAPKNIEIHRQEIFDKIQQQKADGNASSEES